MSVFHSATAFLVPIFPNTNAKRRLGTRHGFSSRVIMLTLGDCKSGILFAKLLERCLGAHFRAPTATALGEVERVFGGRKKTASPTTDAATSAFLVGRSTGILSSGRAAISTALFTACSLISCLNWSRSAGAWARFGRRGFIGF